MGEKYFTLDEKYDQIIKDSLAGKDIKTINPISTGWTNIVYEAESNEGNYFFRFPRDDFWIRTIVKDCEFANYIDGKTSYKTVGLKLLNNKDRAFSMHKKIEGRALTEKMNNLNKEQIKNLSYEISEFMYELHSLNCDDKIFNTNNIGLNLTDFLDELINLHLLEKDKKFWNYKEFSKKENNCLVHGDLNPGNIIVDDNNHISAVIDFGFAGYGNKYFDIARIIGRLPKEFKSEIISSYEELSGQKLDYDILDKEIEIWSNIDNGYINYMRTIGIYE